MASARSETGRPDDRATHPRRRVLVVDDSAFMRRLVGELVAATGEFAVAGTARDGEEAIRQVHALAPDIVTLDIAMPGLDGLAVLAQIMHEAPRPVVMLSAGGDDARDGPAGAWPAGKPPDRAEARATLRALELGAVDFVRKPSGPISVDVAGVGDRLLGALRAAAAMQVPRVGWTASPARPPVPQRAASSGEPAERALVIAASTGGPAALARLLPSLPRGLGAAVLVAQHMPEGFTAGFAERLDGRCALRVREARDGELLHPDVVYLAPGGRHLRVQRTVDGPRAALGRDASVWGVRPAADPLFASAAQAFGHRLAALVLTGMGRDGAEGLRLVRAAGGVAFVQDPTDALIPGMPSAALRHAGADVILSLDDAIPHLVDALQRSGAPASEGPGAVPPSPFPET